MILVWAIFSLWPGLAPVPGPLLILSLVWIPFGLAYFLLQKLLLGIKEVRAYNKIELSNKVLAVILLGLVILFKITTVNAVFAASLIALTVSFVWALRRLRFHLREPPHFTLSLLRKNFRYGLKAYLAALFAFLVLKADLLMVKYMLGAEQAGYYSIAATMADMLYMLPIVVGTILFPELSAMSGNREKWQLTKKTVTLVAFAMIILAGFAALVATPIVRLLFGDQFLPAVPAFIWLMPGILMLSINTVYMNYFASLGMPLIAVYSPGVASIFNIALNTKLIPWLGIVGASTSSTLSYGLMLFASVIYISYMKARLIQ
jgi:O-antigen/teichoic acid export membrane protein